MECQIDLHDYEIPQIEGVLRVLNRFKGSMTFEEFEKATVDEFAGINMRVAVLWTVGGIEALPTETMEFTLKVMVDQPIPEPQITIVSRIKEVEFDHERQMWDVQHATLGLDEPGAIGKSGLITLPKSTSFSKKD